MRTRTRDLDLLPSRIRVLLWLLASLLALIHPHAAPPTAPPLPLRFSKPPIEPPGPSSRRSGVTISEIHYHPAHRPDGRNVEFIEIFNSMPWFEDLSGWRLTGSADFTFPPGFQLPSQGYVVLAASPADLIAVTGATNVLGPLGGSLPNGSGTLRLRNRRSAVMAELQYRDSGGWPAAADGFGPSLVLARPSLGLGNPGAWESSRLIGGSPGGPESTNAPALPGVVINELFVPQADDATSASFVELANLTDSTVDLAGMAITDRTSSDRLVFPTGTTLAPGERRAFTASELGFSPDVRGGTVCLRASADGPVLDCLRYDPFEPGVAWGRTPDGGTRWRRLHSPTPGSVNDAALEPPVVVNEVMYHTPGSNPDDQFVELYNPGDQPADLSGWQLGGGIQATLPENTRLAAGGFGVVARNPDQLLATHPDLKPEAILTSFSGTLSHSGDTVTLLKPVSVIETSTGGKRSTNAIWVMVEDMTYGTGGRWGRWSDGGGSSLELTHPRRDRNEASSWADSDESSKSTWVVVESKGFLDNGATDPPNALEILLYGAGESLIDQVEVLSAGKTNLIANGGFESGTNTWSFQGNHGATTLETTEGYQSSQSLHVRATGAGTTGPNRIRVPLTAQPSKLKTEPATLRARVRWLRGTPNILLRLHGNWMEASGNSLATRNFGTPGAPNSRRISDPAPALSGIRHEPVLPQSREAVRIVAHADSVHGLNQLLLRWRMDPSGATNEVMMSHHGGGLYSAVIPGQPTGTMVAYHILASDAGAAGAISLFPADAPVRECLIRWGDTNVVGALGGYHVWMTQNTFTRWSKREKLSNDPLDVTVAYGNSRVIYNSGAEYSGSPYHAPGFNSPTGANCDYLLLFPADDSFLGEQEMELLQPGNGGGDGTCQGEQQAYWIAEQMGLPACHRRPVLLYVNGTRRGITYDDAQQPGKEMVAEWFPDDAGGEVHKIQLWFEFDAAGANFSSVGADLSRYNTTQVGSGATIKKKERYRWTWPLRAYGDDPNNYTNLYSLVEAVNTTATGDPYTRTLTHATDVENWFRTHIVEHLVGNNDSYSYGGGQNMYAYKPQHGPWKLMIWDIDFAFASADPRSQMDNIGGRNVGPINTHPPFARLFWQIVQEAANGPLLADRSNPIIDARYNGMRAAGATGISSGTSIKSYLATRRTYLLGLVTNKTAPFAFVSNGGADFTSANSSFNLTGTAPLAARTLTLNGNPIDVTWTTLSNWTTRVVLAPGTNAFQLSGLDVNGNVVPQSGASIRIEFTGSEPNPVGQVVLNEILPLPAVPGSGFIELANRSTSAFDLSGWRLDGVGLTFPPGTTLPAGGFGVVVEDAFTFADTFSPLIGPLATYPGQLNPVGETLRLIKPGIPPAADQLIDTLTYDTSAPWPAALTLGASLQRVITGSAHDRPAGWTAAAVPPGALPATIATPGQANLRSAVAPTWPDLRLNELVVDNRSGTSDRTGNRGAWVEVFNAGTTRAVLTNLFLSDTPDPLSRWRFPATATIPAGGFLLVWLDGRIELTSAAEPHASFLPSTGDSVLILTQGTGAQSAVLDVFHYSNPGPDAAIGSLPDGAPGNRRVLSRPTPLASNTSASAGLTVRINEWMTRNDSILRDPLDNAYKDWFELINLSGAPAPLDGCFLTVTTNDARQFAIPSGYTLPAGGRLLVWADKKPTLNSGAGALHTSFKLTSAGGYLGLFSPEGHALDEIVYGPQTADVSEGRIPDGGDFIAALPTATPGAANPIPSPVVFAIQVQSGLANLSWSTIPGQRYQVESATDLSGTTWTAVGEILTASSSTLTSVDSREALEARFYRVKVLP